MGWIMVAIVRVVLSVVFLFLVLTFALDNIALGPGFNMTIVGGAAVALCVTLLLNVFFGRVVAWLEIRLNDLRPLKLSPRVGRVLSGLGALVMVGFSLGTLVWFNLHQSRTIADAEAALANFQVQVAEGLDRSNLNQTLAEFESARRSLEQEWPNLGDNSPITLRLFSSFEEYHAVTGRHYSAGEAFCPPTGAVVWLPLEEAIELPGENDHTRTSLHEMVHAMMCQYLGHEAFYSIPRWFHEGMAELYENEAKHFSIRVENRIRVWFYRDKLFPAEIFCTEPFMRPETEFGLFYMTVLEFARSLETEHGRDSLLGVVNDVQDGISFEESLQNRFGTTCVELYSDWLASW